MLIGLTGGIGSGKSVISRELHSIGYRVYDTDSDAKRLIVEDLQIRQQMETLFGKEVYKDGIYQTHIVADKVFADKSLLAALNAIVHPAVKQDILHWTRHHNQAICFVECAILYSSGIYTLCDKFVAVTAPEAIRLERTIARDHSDVEKVRARMQAQDVEQDILRAYIIINNDGTTPIPTLCQQILAKIIDSNYWL